MKYTCEFGPKRKGYNCGAVLRVKKFFNGRISVERGGTECDHTPTGEERKYRFYSTETKELIQDAIKTNVPAKHIRNKLIETGAVGQEVNTLKGRRSIYQKSARLVLVRKLVTVYHLVDAVEQVAVIVVM